MQNRYQPDPVLLIQHLQETVVGPLTSLIKTTKPEVDAYWLTVEHDNEEWKVCYAIDLETLILTEKGFYPYIVKGTGEHYEITHDKVRTEDVLRVIELVHSYWSNDMPLHEKLMLEQAIHYTHLMISVEQGSPSIPYWESDQGF